MARDAALYRYLEAGRSWDDDRISQALRSARRAWQVAGAAGVLAALAIGAVEVMAGVAVLRSTLNAVFTTVPLSMAV